MTQDNIQTQLLEAMTNITDYSLSQLAFDKTIQGEITSVQNVDTGEYKVRYQSNIFSVFASDVTKTYKAGDTVNISVPNGDFSGKKYITGKASDSSLSAVRISELQNSLVDIAPTFDNIITYQMNESSLIAGISLPQIIYYRPEDYNATREQATFLSYGSKYEYIRVQASFLTSFYSTYTQGNYGIEVVFTTTNEDEDISYKLDSDYFTGNAYTFSTYSTQSVVFQVLKNHITGIRGIFFYQENFDPDVRTDSSGKVIEKITKTPNIFVKDIKLNFVEKIDLSEVPYYLTIDAPYGNVFTGARKEITLQGALLNQGVDIISKDTCVSKWYEKDYSANDVGRGWKYLETADTLTVSFDDVYYKKDYKLVVIYNETTTLEAEITVTNLTREYDITLVQELEETSIQLHLVNNLSDEVLLGNWYFSYPDGSYSLLTEKQNSIKIDREKLLYSSTTFYCGVYDEEGHLIDCLEKTISNVESDADLTISCEGETYVRYDANGDITIEDSELVRSFTPIVAWKDGIGTLYTVEWFDPNGESLSDTNISNRRSVSKSMFKELYVDSSGILYYTVRQKYKVNYTNNILTVVITTIDGQQYSYNKELLFLKDGDQGVNGTTYTAIVRPCSIAGEKLAGFNPLIMRNNNWINSLYLRCYIYKDGELINNGINEDYNFKYTKTGAGISLVELVGEDAAENNEVAIKQSMIQINGSDDTLSTSSYVMYQVDIEDKTTYKSYSIYCSYPIDIAVNFTDEVLDTLDISDIPSYIKYSTSGVTPTFADTTINFLENGIITSETPTILTIKESEEGYRLYPADTFNFSDTTMARLKCSLNSSYILHTIVMYLDTYGNEAINGWDGTSVTGIYELDTSLNITSGREYYEKDSDGNYISISLNSTNYKANTYYYKTAILAPQVGAGKKDSANRFTGVVMGVDSEQDTTGLYGYQSGINTFGLKEDGTAFFGAKGDGGQIIIDGTSATIEGGGGGGNTAGMTITLTDPTWAFELDTSEEYTEDRVYYKLTSNGEYQKVTLMNDSIYKPNTYYYSNKGGTTKAINIGNEQFTVNYNGVVTAKQAEIGGTIYAKDGIFGVTESEIKAYQKNGTIPSYGWGIGAGKLYSLRGTSDTGYIQLNSDISRNESNSYNEPYAIWCGKVVSSEAAENTFAVTKKGVLYARAGQIGGWVLNKNVLVSSSTAIKDETGVTTDYKYDSTGIAASGTYRFWAGAKVEDAEADNLVSISSKNFSDSEDNPYFRVTSAGKLECNSVDIKGTINANSGKIGDWTIKNGSIKAGNTTLESSGKITSSDVELTGTINATQGSIGDWSIQKGKLSNGNTTLTAGGTIETYYVTINGLGDEIDRSKSATLGAIEGSKIDLDTNITTTTYNIGIRPEDSEVGIVLDGHNIALRDSKKKSDSHSYIQTEKCDITSTNLTLGTSSSSIITIQGNSITLNGTSSTIEGTTISIDGTTINIGSSSKSTITFKGSSIDFSGISSANQKGIYARFA